MKSSRLREITKGLMCAIGGYVVFQTGCYHTRQAEREMTWSCKPPEALRVPGLPWLTFGVPTLELRFKDNPAHIEYMTGPTAEQLCQELPRTAKTTLRVRFEVIGSDFHGHVGHNIVGIDGKQIGHQIGDGGSSGAYERINTPSPLANVFRRYFIRKGRLISCSFPTRLLSTPRLQTSNCNIG